jgi:ATP-dependent RNA helicase RhlE
LALQIADCFVAYGQNTNLRTTVVFGGVNQNPQVRQLQRGVDTLVATPGRLLDLMDQGFIDLSSVEIFVLDEADRMLDMGFMPDVRRIIAKLPVERQTLMFSATMPDAMQHLAKAILHDPVRIHIAPSKPTVESVEQFVYFVPKQGKSRWLADYLATQAVSQVLVFTRTKHGADRVARHLTKFGIPADSLHGDKSQAARQRTLASFKANRTSVLVATDIAARGIDVEGISHVLNYDLPQEPETYVHRIGRTGRAGASGIAVSLCDADERPELRAIEKFIRQKLRVDQIGTIPMPYIPTDATATVSKETDAAEKTPFRQDRSRSARSRHIGGARKSASSRSGDASSSSSSQSSRKPRRYGAPQAVGARTARKKKYR